MSENKINKQTLEFLNKASKSNLENVNEKKILITEEQIKKLHEQRELKRGKGEWAGGRMPFGYNTERRNLTIDPVEFHSLKKIFEWINETGTIEPKEIWKHVKEKEIPNRHGVTIPRSTIYRLFEPERIEIYLGEKYNFALFTRKEIPKGILENYNEWKRERDYKEMAE
jgi:hypothetical protein